jgi:glycine/D-amino acid oxidase-like deaminating enzyme
MVTDYRQSLTIDNDTAVVLAAGSWTPLLAAKLNVFVPVYPMKGYSLVADVAGAIAGLWVSVPDLSLMLLAFVHR